MGEPSKVVVVGGGLAGAKTVEALRDLGFDGSITLVGAEQHLPYERPPLSKGFLLGDTPRGDFEVHDQQWYDKHHVKVELQTKVTRIAPADHHVELDQQRLDRLTYDRLVLATGAKPRVLPIAGADADGVVRLRSVDDSEHLRSRLSADTRLVVIGGGWIGLEVAAAARAQGAHVSVVETAELPLGAVLGSKVAQSFVDLHEQHDVQFHLSAQVRQIEASDSRVSGVALGDGTSLAADLVLMAVGANPDVGLAEDAELEVDNGVLVDAGLRSSDPDIFAVGDIANAWHPFLERRIRVEHWANALNQPAVAAANILGGSAEYTELPYFFTDQYDLGMEYLGFATPEATAEVVIRGDLGAREYIAFWLDADRRMLAGMNANIWDVTDELKDLIRSRRPLDPSRIADPDVPLHDL